MKEIEIIPDFSSGSIKCRGCDKVVTLYFNGGELDRTECCGYEYETRATGHELIITPPQDD